MPVALPLIPSEPDYRVSTTLEGVQYIFDLRWNARAEAWYMDVSDENGDIIRSSIKIVLGAPLGKRTRDTRFPPGVIAARDTTGASAEATFDDLGTRVEVFYLTPDEIAAL